MRKHVSVLAAAVIGLAAAGSGIVIGADGDPGEQRTHAPLVARSGGPDRDVNSTHLTSLAADDQPGAGGGGGADGPRKPGGPGRDGGGGPRGPGGGQRGGPGQRGEGMRPGQVLPAPVQEMLKLTPEQKQQVEALQKEVDEKLAKILTEDQMKQLKERRPGRGGPGGPGGPGGGGPRGRGGPGGLGGPGGPGGQAPGQGI